MTAPHRRHDMSYRVWELLEPHLSGRSEKKGRPAKDNRLFLNAVFWNLRTGAHPYQVMGRLWRDRGVCKDLLDTVIDEPDFEWLLMIDSSHIEPQPDGTWARGGKQAIARTKGAELQTASALDSHGMPVRMILTEGTTADCNQAPGLIAGVLAQYLLVGRGYDSDAIVAQAEERGMEAVIPPRRNRKEHRDYDRALYKLRHLVENGFRTSNSGA